MVNIYKILIFLKRVEAKILSVEVDEMIKVLEFKNKEIKKRIN